MRFVMYVVVRLIIKPIEKLDNRNQVKIKKGLTDTLVTC